MNEKQKDKGLMKAVKEQPQFRLTSNFTFRTMQKVEEAILLRERKQERKMLLATIAASLFLIISGSIGLYIYFGKHIKETMYHAFLAGHYKIFCVNGNTGFRNESRIFYFIHLQNEEAYERKESSSA